MNWNLFIKRSAIVIICFLLYTNSKYLFGYVLFGKNNWNSFSIEVRLTIMLISAIIFACLAKYLITKKVNLKDFGLNLSDLPNGLLVATICVIPQLIGLGFNSNWDFELSGRIFYRDLILAGFGEEFIYRAFLFGLLFYYAGWGFLSAGIFTGLFFGWGHLYQAVDFNSAISVFLFSAGASLGFSWFYYAWKSLWMVLFLHAFMDITWDGFNVQTNVTGDLWINVARFTTLFMAILFSIRKAKLNDRLDLKRNGKLWINKNALL
jgi:membrane protease YdiL (CAAX protease family)